MKRSAYLSGGCLTNGMGEPTVNVSSEHVSHSTNGGFFQLRDMSLKRVSMNGTKDRPVHMVQRVYEVHELCEVSI